MTTATRAARYSGDGCRSIISSSTLPEQPGIDPVFLLLPFGYQRFLAAPLARISTPAQMISRDLVLMAGTYSAVAADTQPTSPNESASAVPRFCLVKPAAGECCNRWEL